MSKLLFKLVHSTGENVLKTLKCFDAVSYLSDVGLEVVDLVLLLVMILLHFKADFLPECREFFNICRDGRLNLVNMVSELFDHCFELNVVSFNLRLLQSHRVTSHIHFCMRVGTVNLNFIDLVIDFVELIDYFRSVFLRVFIVEMSNNLIQSVLEIINLFEVCFNCNMCFLFCYS